MSNEQPPLQSCLSRALKVAAIASIGLTLGACGGATMSGSNNEMGKLTLMGQKNSAIMLSAPQQEIVIEQPAVKSASAPMANPDYQQNAHVRKIEWQFAGSNASQVTAAQVAGKYAAADGVTDDIEIRNIRQKLKQRITREDISQLLPDVDLSDSNGVCGMTFTPSGRFLYMVVCAEGSGNNQDAILAYNTNTRRLSVFDRINLSDSQVQDYGITYFKGQLYVGSKEGIYRYDASRNVAYSGQSQFERKLIPTPQAITGLAVDMVDQKIYATTTDSLMRMNPDGSGLEKIATDEHFQSLTMGRVYGNENAGGLFLLKNDGNSAQILTVPTEVLRKGGKVEPTLYHEMDASLVDIAATADGRMMLAKQQVGMMFDSRDARLSYDQWLHDELDNYLAALKSLVEDGDIEGTSNLIGKQGMLMRKIERAGRRPNDTPVADNVGWGLFLLMAIDQIKHDPDIERIIELLIKTHAGLHPDGHGGVRTVDGHFVRVYGNDGLPSRRNPQPQVYVSMKFLPAAFKAAEIYPENENIQQYAEYLRQLFKRSSDTIRAEQRITWTNDDHGPILNNNGMSNETWIYGDIGAAQDPMATVDYATYAYDRDSFNTDNWLQGEPVILSSHAAFIVMGATLILNHHYYGEGWQEQNHNYYGVSMAETDDMGAPYFAAFSAGNHPRCPSRAQPPCGGYYNDGPSDHPNDILHFPAVLGFGQHQYTAPMVGGYMAYRDGRRQEMNNASGGDNIPMLTRWSMTKPDFVMSSVGIADFWYGGIGLVETIAPGTIDKFRTDFYRPELIIGDNNGRVELTYSNMTPRRVIGVDNDGSRRSYGFRMSPFTLPEGVSHDHYEIIDPEGEWFELEDLVSQLDGKPMRFTNPGFERGLDGWTTNGVVDTVDGLIGKNAQITGQGSLSQLLDVSMDLDKTHYIIRAIAKTVDGKGFMRLTWHANQDKNSPALGNTLVSNPVTVENPVLEFEVDAYKPAGASYLRIEYVNDGQADSKVLFDNTSVIRRGAEHPLVNGDFTQGAKHWEVYGGARVVNNPSGEGKAIRFRRGQHQKGWQNVYRNIDVSGDPLGTRYIFRFDTDTENAEDFKFEVKIQSLSEEWKPGDREGCNRNPKCIVERRDLGDVLMGDKGEKVFTMRRRPQDHTYRVNFRMKRNDDAKGDAEVYMSNFRIDKERLFREESCIRNSATNCL